MFIPFQAHEVHPSIPPGDLEATSPRLLWAISTVGRRSPFDVLEHSWHSLLEIAYRIALLQANLNVSTTGITRTAAYDSLDGSEKRVVSYYVGMVAAKLIASQLFQVPWLMHLDRYRAMYSVELSGSRRPDLFGVGVQENWCVMEAKGRSGRIGAAVLSDLLASAKDQAQRVTLINGTAPTHQVGSASHYAFQARLRVDFVDPPGAPDEWEPELDFDQFVRAYYQALLSLLRSPKARMDEDRWPVECKIYQITEGVAVGLVAPVLALLTNGDVSARRIIGALQETNPHADTTEILLPGAIWESEDKTRIISSDGVVVHADPALPETPQIGPGAMSVLT